MEGRHELKKRTAAINKKTDWGEDEQEHALNEALRIGEKFNLRGQFLTDYHRVMGLSDDDEPDAPSPG